MPRTACEIRFGMYDSDAYVGSDVTVSSKLPYGDMWLIDPGIFQLEYPLYATCEKDFWKMDGSMSL